MKVHLLIKVEIIVAISLAVKMFSKSRLLQRRQDASLCVKGLTVKTLFMHVET